MNCCHGTGRGWTRAVAWRHDRQSPKALHLTRGLRRMDTLMAETPLALPRSGDSATDTYTLMTKVNETVERWVREHPEQWLWVHRRWPD